MELGECRGRRPLRDGGCCRAGGYDFYEKLRAQTLSARVQKELEYLRDEETGHKSFFLEQLHARGRSPGASVAPRLQAILENEFIKPLQELFLRAAINDNLRTLGFGLPSNRNPSIFIQR